MMTTTLCYDYFPLQNMEVLNLYSISHNGLKYSMITTTLVVDFLALPPKYGAGKINFTAPQWQWAVF